MPADLAKFRVGVPVKWVPASAGVPAVETNLLTLTVTWKVPVTVTPLLITLTVPAAVPPASPVAENRPVLASSKWAAMQPYRRSVTAWDSPSRASRQAAGARPR